VWAGRAGKDVGREKRENIMESTREARTEAHEKRYMGAGEEDDLCPFCEAGGIRSPADSDAPWVGVDVGNTELLYGCLCRSCMDAGIDLG
jgi:hypothetical protein